MHVLCLGAGRLGSAVDDLLQDRGHYLALWDIDPKKAGSGRPVNDLAKDADVVFVCMPSWCIVDALTPIIPHLKPGAIVVSFSKGILRKSKRAVHEELQELLGAERQFVLVGGPMMAEELRQGMGGVGIAAGSDPSAAATVVRLFRGTTLRMNSSDDLVGVAFSAVAKNIYATVMGLADGLKWQGNLKGALGAACLKELPELVTALGGREETALGPAGVGDFLATAMSPYSKNRRIGEEWAKTGTCCILSEGTVSVGPILERLGDKAYGFPLLRAIGSIVIKGRDPEATLTEVIGLSSAKMETKDRP